MYNLYMKLTKKKMTKLLNKQFRQSILQSAKLRLGEMFQYAKYVVDTQILQRNMTYENDKSSCYGFQPLNIICAIKADGTIEKKLFEFNIINHFLLQHDAESAIEVVMCILQCWLEEDKSIVSFDYNTIDKALSALDNEYVDSEEKDNANSKQ